MSSVQFFGIPNILRAYADYDVECWAVFDGRDMLRAGEGSEELQRYLNFLADNGTQATYVLRVYPGCDAATEITRNTDYNGFFKFRLQHQVAGNNQAVAGVGGRPAGDPIMAIVYEHYAEKFAKLVKKDLGAADKEEDREESIGDILKDYLRNPKELIEGIAAIRGMFTGQPQQLAAIAGVKDAPHRTAGDRQPRKQPTEKELDRLETALDQLGEADDNLIAHLEMLARLAIENPDMYKIAINKLKALS